MHKKALTFVTGCMLFCCILLLSARLTKNNSYASPQTVKDEENQVLKKELEVKTKEETKKSTDYIDLVNLDSINNNVEVKNSEFVIPEELLNELNSTISSYTPGTSFIAVNLNDGMTIGYNIDQAYPSGSTIKVSYALYVYKLIDQNKASLDDKIAYQAKFYNKGTGLIKNSAYGTEYTIKELLYYMINESDNSAYLMLLDKYGWDGFNEMLDDLGAVELHLGNISRWGKLSCRSSAIVWQEIYRFGKKEGAGAELFDLVVNAKYNYFKEVIPDIPSASKSGFTETVVHDTGLILEGDNPYIIIILTNTNGDMGTAYNQVKMMFSKIYPIMKSYNEYLGK